MSGIELSCLKKISKYSFPLLIALSVTIYGCSKAKVHNRLKGSWQKVNVMDPASITIENWIFEPTEKNAGDFYMTNSTGSKVDTINKAIYAVETSLTKRYVNITGGLSSLAIEAKWEVVKMKKNEMILVSQQGGKVIYEFIKP